MRKKIGGIMPQVAILAGGRATRLRSITEGVPKSLIEIAGKPFIAHQLELLKEKGIFEVVICVGHLGDKIRSYVKDGSRFGMSVAYSFDGDTPLGTGGALFNALPLLDDIFFVMYGDSYLDADLKPIFKYFISYDKMAMMTVFRNENRFDRSNVIYRGHEVIKYDKKNISPEMNYIDYGLIIFRKKVFDGRSKGKIFDLADFCKGLVNEREMLGYEVYERFYEIGSPSGLKETTDYLTNRLGK